MGGVKEDKVCLGVYLARKILIFKVGARQIDKGEAHAYFIKVTPKIRHFIGSPWSYEFAKKKFFFVFFIVNPA